MHLRWKCLFKYSDGEKNGSVRLAFEGFTFLACDTFSDSQTSRAEKREILQKKRSKIVHPD